MTKTNENIIKALAVVLAISTSVGLASAQSRELASSRASDEPARAQWRQKMHHKATPGEGCFQASFPADQWKATPCQKVSGHAHPLPLVTEAIGSATAGNGNDYVLVAPDANLITQTVGSFPSVRGVTSETGAGGADDYSLQINTNFNSTTSACSGGGAGCTVWQQFLYVPGNVFIQYWLIGYRGGGASCPAGYITPVTGTNCYKNSASTAAPSVPATGLGNVTLTGTAASGGNDTVTFTNGGTAYSLTASDSVLKIATVWNQSEFNIVGDANSSQANFNAGSVITVNVAAQYGSTTAPTCASGGTTAETNNLNLLPCTATGGASPNIQFIESLLTVPTISKAFNPASIRTGATSLVTLTLTNPNVGIALTGAAFSDGLSGISAAGGAVGGTCTGTSPATLSAGATSLNFTGITIPAGASCTVTFNVTGAIPGTFPNTASGVSSNEALIGSASNTTTLIVIGPPAISKTFGVASVPLGSNANLSFTISNPDTVSLSGVGFTDTLPAGLVVASAAGAACGGGTITATAGSGSIALTGATLAAGTQCTFTIVVTGTAPGVKNNQTSVVTSTEGGNGNSATASIQVIAPPVITKTFVGPKVIPGGTTTLSLSILNPNNFAALAGVAFTDSLPASVVVGTPNGLTNTCGGAATATAGSATVSLTGGSIAASSTCTVTVNVTGTTEGIFVNSVQVTSTNGGTGNTSSATLFVATPPNLSKTFGEVSIGVGNTTSLSFTLSNPNHIVTLNALQFSDTLPTGLVVATPNGLTGACDGGTITAVAGGNLITLGSAALAPQASCTFRVNITSDGAALGYVTNTTSTVTSTEALPGAAASAVLFIGNPFQVSYAANLAAGDSFTNISNAGTLGAALQSGTTAAITGALCANVYAFTPDEQLVSCCSCPVTPNGLVSLSAANDLASNTLTPAVPGALVIKLLATVPVAGSCTNSAASVGSATLANGMVSFGTTLHATPTVGTFGVTETPFSPATLSAGELSRIGQLCNFILANGSGFGVCRSCRLGGLGSERQ